METRGSGWELYDMQVDPTELNNLIQTNPELARDLAAKWAAWAKRVGVANVKRLANLQQSPP